MPIFILLLLLCLGGCATTTEHQPGPFQAPVHRGLAEDPTVERPFLIDDPWEGFNRSMYNFNAKFDRYVYLPVVDVYEQVLPDSVQNGISNVFNNLKEIPIFVNSVLQGKARKPRSLWDVLSSTRPSAWAASSMCSAMGASRRRMRISGRRSACGACRQVRIWCSPCSALPACGMQAGCLRTRSWR